MLESEKLTTRSIGIEAHVDFGPDWDGLVVTANVYGSGVSIDALIGADGKLVIPHECLETAGGRCKIAFQGVDLNEDGIAVRQVSAYADLGIIAKGMEPSGETEAPATLRLWEQVEANLANETMLREASDTALSTLIAGVNETVDTVNEKVDVETERATAAEQKITSEYIESDCQILSNALNAVSKEALARAEADRVLSEQLADKAPSLHRHEMFEVNGLGETLASKQDKLVAGNNITIVDNVISATGGGSGGGAVESVNGKTGAVKLYGTDIHMLSNQPVPLTSVINNKSDKNHNHDGVYQPIGDYATQDDIPTDAHIIDLIDEHGTSNVVPLSFAPFGEIIVNNRKLAQDANVWEITKDDDGNNLNLKAAWVSIKCSGPSGQSDNVFANYGANSNYTFKTSFIRQYAYPRNRLIIADCFNGIIFQRSFVADALSFDDKTQTQYLNSNTSEYFGKCAGNAITSFIFSADGNKLFSSENTYITIYGIRM